VEEPELRKELPAPEAIARASSRSLLRSAESLAIAVLSRGHSYGVARASREESSASLRLSMNNPPTPVGGIPEISHRLCRGGIPEFHTVSEVDREQPTIRTWLTTGQRFDKLAGRQHRLLIHPVVPRISSSFPTSALSLNPS